MNVANTVTCLDNKGRENEIAQGLQYEVAFFNWETFVVYLRGIAEPFSAGRFLEYQR